MKELDWPVFECTKHIQNAQNNDQNEDEIHVLKGLILFICYRYLVKFSTSLNEHNTQYTLETQFSYDHHYRVVDPSGIIGRLQNIQVF